ncbi:hypothetical protein N0V94_004959 [Neodidymelliopsis sp. IMI 364377]|nr:hypothetical protein N0V94_004959 [Neodidymelliopsis sp. IMI 364377]
MSFAKHSLEIFTYDAPEYPDTLPPGVNIIVPFPAHNHPDYTTNPWAGVGIPETFDDLIELPNPNYEPALYAAAVDTMRMTNWCFELSGEKNVVPLTQAKLESCERRWRRREREWREETQTAAQMFPRPPDLRTLFVKEGLGDPADKKLKDIWTRACKDVEVMSDAAKDRYLRYTLDQVNASADLRADQSWRAMELFKRYLVWRDHVVRTPPDQQPTRAEMEAFFNREDVREKGATLAEICHAFPYARNARMLVLRIQRFASLQRQPPVKTKGGVDDPVESRYMRHPVPTKAEIVNVVMRSIGANEFFNFPELLQRWWPYNGNEQFIADVLVTIARPDLTTRRFIDIRDPGPGSLDIYDAMGEGLSGMTLPEIARRFPNRVGSLYKFIEDMDDVTYQDPDDELYYPRYEDPNADSQQPVFLDAEESLLARNRFRIDRTWMPENVGDDYWWDASIDRYVRREAIQRLSNIVGVQTLPIEPPSPTEAASEPASPPPRPQVSLQIGVISAVDTVPIEPPSPTEVATEPASSQKTVQSGAGSTGAVAPESDGARTPPGSPPRPSGGRPGKRAAAESLEPRGKSKKVRQTVRSGGKTRCSQLTLKGTRCRRAKDSVEGETEWNCGLHNRG